MDLLNDLLGYEQEPFGSSISQPDEALEQAKQAAIQEALDSAERKKRLKMLEDVIKTNPRQRQNDVYQEIIKNKYGFKPNSIGKKIGATALETLMGGLSLGQSNAAKEAATLAEKDYANKISGFNTLLSQENAAQKTANQSAQYIYSQMLKDKQNENKLSLEGKKVNQAGELGNKRIQNEADRISILKDAEKRKALETEAKNNLIKLQGEQTSAKTEDILRRNKAIEEYNKSASPTMQWDILSVLKGKALDNYMANVASTEEVDNFARFTRLMTDAGTREKDPGIATVTTSSTTSSIDPLTKLPTSVETKTPQFVKKPGTPRPELSPFTRGTKSVLDLPSAEEVIKGEVFKKPDPVAVMTQKPIAQVTPQAKKIAQAVTTPNAVSEAPSDPKEAAKFYFKKAQEPYTPKMTTASKTEGVKTLQKHQELVDEWQQTANITRDLADTVANGIITGELDKYKGAFNTNKLISAVRAITGRPFDEVQTSQKAMMALADHLKVRFGNASRPAYQLIQAIEHSITNDLDNPDTYAKSQLAMSLMVDLGYQMAKNPNFKLAMDNITKAYNGLDPKTNWSGAVNALVEQTVKDLRNKKYTRLDANRVFNYIVDNLEKPKAVKKSSTPVGGSSPLEVWRQRNKVKFFEDEEEE